MSRHAVWQFVFAPHCSLPTIYCVPSKLEKMPAEKKHRVHLWQAVESDLSCLPAAGLAAEGTAAWELGRVSHSKGSTFRDPGCVVGL